MACPDMDADTLKMPFLRRTLDILDSESRSAVSG